MHISTHLFRRLGRELVPAFAVFIEQVDDAVHRDNREARVVGRVANVHHFAHAVRRRDDRAQVTKLHWIANSGKMARSQGATLQNYNNELVKGVF